MICRWQKRLGTSLLALLGLSIAACSQWYSEGDFFWIRNGSADLPVWVRGNIDSGVMIVWVHGGPGGSGLVYSGDPALRELERDYGIVYWDQRVSGTAQGQVRADEITLAHFIDDLDLLTDVVIDEYHPRNVFLVGHSWGGTLASAYLGDDTRQHKYSGWVEIDGGHDMPRMHEASTAWLDAHAAAEIAEGREVEQWQEARNWLADAPPPATWGLAEFIDFTGHLQPAQPYWVDASARPEISPGEYVFASPLSLAMFFNPAALQPKFNILAFDFSTPEVMGKIRIPSMFMWGAHDGVSPPTLAQDAYAAVATPIVDKYVRVYAESGHSPFAEEPEAFVADMREFLERYRQSSR